MEKGILGDTVPLELNAKELAHRNNKNSELIVYGYTSMMVSVQCVQKTMDRCNHACAQYTLKDRYQKEFHGVCSCEFCYNTIYNALPTSLLKEKEKAEKLGVEAYRLSFTTETEKDCPGVCGGLSERAEAGRMDADRRDNQRTFPAGRGIDRKWRRCSGKCNHRSIQISHHSSDDDLYIFLFYRISETGY